MELASALDIDARRKGGTQAMHPVDVHIGAVVFVVAVMARRRGSVQSINQRADKVIVIVVKRAATADAVNNKAAENKGD